MVRSRLWLLATAFCVQKCAGQTQAWVADEVNTTVCEWTAPRAAVVRDTVYIDGGDLEWLPTLSNGSLGQVTPDANLQGFIYLLNFSTPFQTTPNFNQSAIFTNKTKSTNGEGANNIGPNYVDGAMFANDYEWWIYGGLTPPNGDTSQAPQEDDTAYYEVYSSETDAISLLGFATANLPSNVSGYVAWGAGVSVPSENLGFYFGGLQSKTGGPIFYDPGTEDKNADSPSPWLIKLEMDRVPQGNATWTNETIKTIPSRASAELVWVPVSEQGILVGIGGVINPVYATVSGSDTQSEIASSNKTSPTFMETVAVYDIHNNKWYDQQTSGPQPPALAQGCAVVASAKDGSSHNIYWYGGFNGVDQASDFNDAVWILSIPSFTWVKFTDGTAGHGRAGHRCVKPYPDQMFVIGGYPSQPEQNVQCLGNIIQVFNLSSGEWLDSYDPRVWSEYQVPEQVFHEIGGSSTGNATATTPSAGFASPTMADIFASQYDTSKITTFYPYPLAAPTQAPSVSSSSAPAKSGGGTPSYLAPVLAVILGLFFITLLVIGILLWRRRRLLRTNRNTTHSESGTMSRVANWIRVTPGDDKAPTVTTDEMGPVPDKIEMFHVVPEESGGTQVHEMDGTSSPTELRDTGLLETGDHDNTLRETGLVPATQTPLHELASQAERSGPRPVSISTLPRADSPTAVASNARVTSISSDFDHRHVRELSEASISTAGNRAASVEPGASQPSEAQGPTATLHGQRAGAVSPLTPSEVGGDYLNKGSGAAQEGQPASTGRTSNFSEELGEVKDTK